MKGNRKESFAPVFYRRHCWHQLRQTLKICLFLAAIASLSVVSVRAYFETGRFPFLAALMVAALLFFSYASIVAYRELFQVRLLPYFSRRLNEADTFLRGKALLSHSRKLDEIADRLLIRRLSTFASGDDLVLGERLLWHEPQPAIETIVKLQECSEAVSFPSELKSDLHALREALQSANRQSARFCLILREGSCASGLEMDRRKGSFF